MLPHIHRCRQHRQLSDVHDNCMERYAVAVLSSRNSLVRVTIVRDGHLCVCRRHRATVRNDLGCHSIVLMVDVDRLAGASVGCVALANDGHDAVNDGRPRGPLSLASTADALGNDDDDDVAGRGGQDRLVALRWCS